MSADVSSFLPAGVLLGWLRRQRWFAAKDREPRSLRVSSTVEFASDPLGMIVLLDVELGEQDVHRYQLVIGARRDLPASLTEAVIGRAGDRWYYDGLADPRLCSALLTGMVRGPLDPAAIGSLPVRRIGAEQSNTSVVFGDRFILKVFRRIWPGAHPEVTLHQALRGNPHVATLVGSAHAGDVTLAVLQEFAADATDGWTLAQADLRADTEGFTADLRRLGGAVATVHRDLAAALGCEPLRIDSLTDRLLAGLAQARRAVPDLSSSASAVHRLAAAFRTTPADHLMAQRIHGDLHLGQVLRTPHRWLLIDFEGEPARPIAERTIPDSPLRDVAGVLRSLDYVAGHAALTAEHWSAHDAIRARAWVHRNQHAFLNGYATGADTDPRTAGPLLAAYQLDKALYEVTYEAQHRPKWTSVPLRAIADLTAATR